MVPRLQFGNPYSHDGFAHMFALHGFSFAGNPSPALPRVYRLAILLSPPRSPSWFWVWRSFAVWQGDMVVVSVVIAGIKQVNNNYGNVYEGLIIGICFVVLLISALWKVRKRND